MPLIKIHNHLRGGEILEETLQTTCYLWYMPTLQFLSFEQIWFQIEKKPWPTSTYIFVHVQKMYPIFCFNLTLQHTYFFSIGNDLLLKRLNWKKNSVVAMSSFRDEINIWHWKLILFNARITPFTKYNFNRQYMYV